MGIHLVWRCNRRSTHYHAHAPKELVVGDGLQHLREAVGVSSNRHHVEPACV